MPFEISTLDEMRDILLAALSGRLPMANVGQRSGNYKRQSVTALGVLDNHFHIRQVTLDVMEDTAEGTFLERHVAIWGLARKGASGSSGDSALRVFGDSGATVPTSEPMTHLPSGLTFETTSGGVIPAGGFLDVDVAATSTGAQTDLEVDQELNFDSTPTGLEQASRIIVELENGQDDEFDDALRTRLLNRVGEPARGGTRNDWENFVLEAAAFVDTAYAYPNRNGAGTVDLVGLKTGSGGGRLLSSGERTTILTAVDLVRPVSATVRVLETTELETDVEALIWPESGPEFQFDWDDESPPTVLSYVSSTRVLTFTAARPVDMKVGDRLVVDTAGHTGVQDVIESLSGTDAVVLTADPGYSPSSPDNAYSGGPITEAIFDRIKALIDGLGPANPDAVRYGPWEGTLRLSSLFETIQTAPGVLDSSIADPVANVEAGDPAFPDNDTVELITPGKIVVRKDPTAP